MSIQHGLKFTFSILASALLIGTSAFAADASVANINQGNVKTGGSLTFSHYTSEDTSYTTISLNPTVQYFLIDNFAVGVAFALDHLFATNGYTDVSVGPVASYHLRTDSKFVPFIQEGFNYIHTTTAFGSHLFDLESQVGVEYFFTPSVALGPAARWLHVFGNDDTAGTPYGTSNDIGLLVQFGLYL